MSILQRKPTGFTIVELLIVIVVIGILAAITIVAYNGIQNRARVSAVKSDFSNAAKKIEIFKLDSTTSSYPVGASNLTTAGVTFTKSNYLAMLWCYNNTTTPTAWALVADAKDGKTYYINSVTNTFAEFTANKVQNISGGTTCPLSGGGGAWLWLLQTPEGAWAI